MTVIFRLKVTLLTYGEQKLYVIKFCLSNSPICLIWRILSLSYKGVVPGMVALLSSKQECPLL